MATNHLLLIDPSHGHVPGDSTGTLPVCPSGDGGHTVVDIPFGHHWGPTHPIGLPQLHHPTGTGTHHPYLQKGDYQSIDGMFSADASADGGITFHHHPLTTDQLSSNGNGITVGTHNGDTHVDVKVMHDGTGVTGHYAETDHGTQAEVCGNIHHSDGTNAGGCIGVDVDGSVEVHLRW